MRRIARELAVMARKGWLPCWLGCAMACGGVAAAEYPDPTRPPASYAAEGGEAGQEPGGPVLQSVIVGPHGTSAIISGQTVKVGSKVGEAKVVAISASEVRLRIGGDVQVLKLFPNIDKRSTSSRSDGERRHRQKR